MFSVLSVNRRKPAFLWWQVVNVAQVTVIIARRFCVLQLVLIRVTVNLKTNHVVTYSSSDSDSDSDESDSKADEADPSGNAVSF